MIRVVDVGFPRNATERRRLERILEAFAKTFTGSAKYIETIRAFLERPESYPYAVIIRALEDGRGRLQAFAIIHLYNDLKCAYLDYIASPDRALPGRGASLYEHIRSELVTRGIDALVMDVPPDEPSMVRDPSVLPANRARLAFYEAFGARPIANTAYEDPPPLGQDYDPPFLVYDALDGAVRLSKARTRKIMEAVLVRRYEWDKKDPHTLHLVASINDQPVQLRPFRYRKAAPDAVPANGPEVVVVVPTRHTLHHVQQRGYVERPARVSVVLEGLKTIPHREISPKAFPRKHTLAVHDKDFVSYLDKMAVTLGEKEALYPYVFPIRHPDRKPKEAWVRAGYYCIDTFTPLSRGAIAAAKEGVDCALTAADVVARGAPLAYAVCRPPGHHAERRVFGGFCYFNNAAIAANMLSQTRRVAFLDIDHHHGNGSQDIFYHRDDVLFVSIHGDPAEAYPYFSGFADEVGAGPGVGFNLNFPLPEGCDDARYLATLKKALRRIEEHKPETLVISLGVDIMKGDPTGMFNLTTDAMEAIGHAIGALRLPLVVVQEGGYRLKNIRAGVRAFFAGVLKGLRDDDTETQLKAAKSPSAAKTPTKAHEAKSPTKAPATKVSSTKEKPRKK